MPSPQSAHAFTSFRRRIDSSCPNVRLEFNSRFCSSSARHFRSHKATASESLTASTRSATATLSRIAAAAPSRLAGKGSDFLTDPLAAPPPPVRGQGLLLRGIVLLQQQREEHARRCRGTARQAA
eukprot:CAMPEP_0178404188 /NCGR_PEP_ID=MMETSP0689_2-20121128/17751_1 /TAXON_ID=160604 /ORGANISM="Amphidinium massartii, Strain CS-259" /LENGTH=124 /DNA_ID=CAMNT_0020025157 /DNA_START=267 /DNA_END=641 /DNA_ORIENTATION=+